MWLPLIGMCHSAPLIFKVIPFISSRLLVRPPPVLPFGLLQVTQVLVGDVLPSPLIHLLR